MWRSRRTVLFEFYAVCYILICIFCLATAQEGLTPLHLAALYGSEEIVRILVQEFQMNPDIADYVSNTFHAIFYARIREHNRNLAVVVGGEMGQIVQNHTGIIVW